MIFTTTNLNSIVPEALCISLILKLYIRTTNTVDIIYFLNVVISLKIIKL